jgi:hypothetical protein
LEFGTGLAKKTQAKRESAEGLDPAHHATAPRAMDIVARRPRVASRRMLRGLEQVMATELAKHIPSSIEHLASHRADDKN